MLLSRRHKGSMVVQFVLKDIVLLDVSIVTVGDALVESALLLR